MQNADSRATHHASRFTFHVSRFTPHASRLTHHDHGVALVITLVLLSVITFMAVTFLVVSRSQHGSVATETDQ
jgi:Tfp pilus assembly protein PilX